MAYSFFEDQDNLSAIAKPRQPIWALNLDDPLSDKEILNWLNGELLDLQKNAEERHRLMQRNLVLYKGIQYIDQSRGDIRERGQDRSQPVRKIVANHIFDLIQNHVSRLIKYKPAVSVLPTNDEFGDKVSAKMTKYLLDHIWYERQFESKLSVDAAKLKAVMGEVYMFITWNPDLGDLHPDYKKLKGKSGDKIPLLDESGEQQKDERGQPVFVSRPVRTGDVDYSVVNPLEIFLENKTKFEDVDYVFRMRTKPAAELRLIYPDKASVITPSQDFQLYNYEKMQLEPLRNQTVYYEFYHRPSLGLDKGRYIVFTKDAVLVNKEYPYSHRDLPFVRLTDIDVPGEVYGKSGIENIKALTATYNNLLNLVVRNQILVSHPKWMMPAGAAKKEALGNDITIVEYKGPQPPALVQSNPTSPETFEFMKALKEEFQQIYGIYGVSRGEPPPGIKAGVALQFLSEQENERFNEFVLKYNEFIRRVAIMTLSVAGSYYDASDDRMIRVIGKDNKWMTEFFDTSNLSKDYDVRVQNSSALSTSRAQRTQNVLDLAEKFPNIMTQEQVIDILDLAQNDKFVDAATASVRTAEAENELILQGKAKADGRKLEPEPYEDHVMHWKTHVQEMRKYSYKFETPVDLQDEMKDMVIAHEMFMVQYAKINPAYMEKLATLDGFPLFYRTPEIAAQINPPQPASMATAQPMPEMSQGVAQNPQEPVNVPTPSIQDQLGQEQRLEAPSGVMESPSPI